MLNPTRIEYLKILKKMGGKILVKKTNNISGEQSGNITGSYSKLKGVNIDKSLSPFLIDSISNSVNCCQLCNWRNNNEWCQ